jgi:hypothetical protein
MGVVPLTSDHPNPTVESALNDLRDTPPEDELEQLAVSRMRGACRHVTFLREIPWGAWPEHFARLRVEMLRLDSLFRYYTKCRRSIEALPQLMLPGHRLSADLVVMDAQCVNGVISVRLWDGARRCCTEHQMQADAEVSRELKRISRTWQRVCTVVLHNTSQEALHHPAVELQWAGGALVAASVNRAHLEKSELRWWPVRQVQSALSGSYPSRSVFRAHFAELMPTAMQRLRELARSSTTSASR